MASSDSDLSKKTKNLKIKDDSFINILLLGETGVGKSTFINSIANYVTYSDFKKAETENLLALIPSKCKVQDKNNEYHIIQMGSEDQNECLDTGMSATQDVKSYVFPIWGGSVRIRLIDTPGIGDVRGIDQDNINCESILSYIGQLHELHAICYLFKPTNPRITTFFDYCMTQLLSRLDKSASKNIIFVFTNTRGTDYNPGDTLQSLEKVIRDIKSRPPYVDIPLQKNIFCFDNEAFRYLAAIKQGIEFDSSIKKRNSESWKKSVDQCDSLIKYIVGDAKNPPLKPHFIKSTSAVNEARRLIVQLSQPLAEISQLISDNLFALQRHQDELDLDSNTLDELRQKLYMPVIDLEIIKLTQPVTVCASRNCAEIYKVGDTHKWHYKQRCHDPCYLKDVPKEIIGSPKLIHCAAIDTVTKSCIKCHCDFSSHMHIYYLSKTIDSKIVDKNVEKNIDNKQKLLQNARKLIADISIRKDELEKEHNIIVKTCAKFAHFLQNNAITPFSDSYKEYIEYLIMRERSLGVLSKMSVIHHLQNLLQEYDAAKESFNEALELQKKIGVSDVLITAQKIQDSIQELYKLKHNGKKIKELYECQKKSRTKEHKHTEYVHEVLSELKGSTGVKEDKTKKNDFQQKKQNKEKQSGENKKSQYKQNSRDRSQPRNKTRNQSPPPAYQDLSGRGNNPRPFNHPYNNRDPHYNSQSASYPNYHQADYSGPHQPHSYNYRPHPRDVPPEPGYRPADFYPRGAPHEPGYAPAGHYPRNDAGYRPPTYDPRNVPHEQSYRSTSYDPRNVPHEQGYRPPTYDPRNVPHEQGYIPPSYYPRDTPHDPSYRPVDYSRRYDQRDGEPRRGNESDSFEFKVVVNKPQSSEPPVLKNIPPPSPHPPSSYYYPDSSSHRPYPVHHDGGPYQSDNERFGYWNQSVNSSRPMQNQRPPNEHYNNPNKRGGRGSSRGRGQGQNRNTQNFKKVSRKKQNLSEKSNDSDSNSD